MTNPTNAIRMLITYAVCIPLAIVVGYLLTDPLDYGSLGLFGFIALILMSPIFIGWHYPIMILALGTPAYAFFLKGNPPVWQVMTILSFGIAVVERTMNSQKRFISPAVMVWPMLFTVAIVYMTAKLTGGIGLKALGGVSDGGVGGGKKYIEIFLGAMCFFALTSRNIPVERRKLYIVLYFIGGLPSFVSDLFPVLPGPLKYINLVFPPSGAAADENASALLRLGGLSASAGALFNYLLARYGLRGLLMANRLGLAVLFSGTLFLSLMGGFRLALVTDGFILGMFFIMEEIHRTRMLLVVILLGILGLGIVIPFARHMPESVQRTLTVLPFSLNLDPAVVEDAEGSKMWRESMWSDLWPRVPGYLLLGKGYSLTAEDYQYMGTGQFVNTFRADNASTGLAVSGDYHSGPLSTLIPFGIWGGISITWLMAAALFITWRNYRYSVPELQTVNLYFFILSCWHVLCFLRVFGDYGSDVFFIGRTVGFSVALNWGIRVAKPVASHARPVVNALARRRMPPPQRPQQPQAA